MTEAFVSSHSTRTGPCRTVIFFFAGVLTYRNNFEAAAREIAKRYHDAKIVMIFPYGMANGIAGSALLRLLARQLTQIGYDFTREQSRRVATAAEIIREHAAAVDHIILIGHSAGGVVAYRTGLYLEETCGFPQVQVFAVGCPKFFIKDIAYNERFTYITGQNPDRITQIGRWRKPGSKLYRGKPGRELQIEFNPGHQGWRFHASYFLDSVWTDANEVFRSNSEELIARIHDMYSGEC
ncbi:hypothetical protein JCM10914A_49260 [Paenibacillus sp. JCM 10914]|uniref:hypothetical protein n=1 Tax=Paenibacillus sp. JCM 10914 TaxID=1236974 RepID=UPI0003CCB83B|nr:hypothetical protein [Paenibacillus sp. JCM 10914]GAE08949.1 hypothetical protein JCM10914_5286 [Paenibacillus sp. JCM 10914]